LRYFLGDKAADVIQATGIMEADKNKYDKGFEKNRESVELSITALHQAADTCVWWPFKEKLFEIFS